MAAMFLAAKVTEYPKKVRDVCNVFHRIFRRRRGLPATPLDIGSEVCRITGCLVVCFACCCLFLCLSISNQEYWNLRNEVIKTERWLLKELGFIVQVVHPHKFVLNFLRVLDANTELTQKAWNYVNDR
jgi:hypothetical protein